MAKKKAEKGRKFFGKIQEIFPIPNLIEIQCQSFEILRKDGLRQALAAVSPIEDSTGNLVLEFLNYELDDPPFDVDECRERDMTYGAPLKVMARLINKETGEVKEQEVYMGEFPLMTERGTFIINGAERVVVSQLVRSPGVYFKEELESSGASYCSARIIPNRGAWIQFDYDPKNIISIRIDKTRKIPITTFLRAIGFVVDADGKNIYYPSDSFTVANPRYEDLVGMFAAKQISDPVRNTVLVKKNQRVSHEQAQEVARVRIPEVELMNRIKDLDIRKSLENTLDRDNTTNTEEALIEIYKKLRPGDPPNIDNARKLIHARFFDPRRYDLSPVGRYKMNVKLGIQVPLEVQTLTKEDIIETVRYLLMLKAKKSGFSVDDIDHLGNRRIRSVGELIQNQFRVGLMRMERVIKERMIIQDMELLTPQSLINTRPVMAAIKEFFGSSQLSQFMDQTNPLAELTHKRRLSALGPGGLSRERAGFEVRDVHDSHYGRICPIESPEGPNIGLIGSLSTFGRVNPLGFIETPYRPVTSDIIFRVVKQIKKGVKVLHEPGEKVPESVFDEFGSEYVRVEREHHVVNKPDEIVWLPANEEERYRELIVEGDEMTFANLLGRVSSVTVNDPDTGETIARRGEKVSGKIANKLIHSKLDSIKVTDPIRIAQANVALDEHGHFVEERIAVRENQDPTSVSHKEVLIDYVDVSPKQIVSITTSLIPFLEHDDANRALMGSNMQRQAVPLIRTEAPLVGTGIESKVAVDSGAVITATADGKVAMVTAAFVEIEQKNGEKTVQTLPKFRRSNQGTCINFTPQVKVGQKVKQGDVIADGPCTEAGRLSLGRNVLVAFMPWYGYNFEDAIVISEKLVKEDAYSSIHIEKYECEARDTKLGPEEITRDIPSISEDLLKHLDEDGIIKIGSQVQAEDILVGKVIPKGETELTAEEKLLRAIFGEKARDVRNTSLKVPHGGKGKVIDVKVFSREHGDELKQPGINKLVRVYVAQKKKVLVGDKVAGRHGNKGVIARIVPEEDMPFLEDGTPVEIILNPLGVPSRMNVGQVLETHLGWAAKKLNMVVDTPIFDGATVEEIKEMLAEAGLPADGKVPLYDGKTGEAFGEKVTVGCIYMMKLNHLVDDKMHARSTGSYALVTQQPLGGKAQFGGQRFGEMEVWALEAYGAAYTLQELLTVKSDDVTGRVKTYEAIVKGENIMEPGVPESFNVLVKELNGLGLEVELITKFGREARPIEDRDVDHIARELGMGGYGRYGD